LGVSVAGSFAYVGDESALRIIDVANPALPVEIGNSPGSAYAVEVVGSMAYVSASYDGLRIVDVSDPAAPIELGAIDTPGSVRDIVVRGGLAYLAEYERYERVLRIIDVLDPSAPVEVSVIELEGGWAIRIVDGLAYVADGFAGVAVVDVANPLSPLLLGSRKAPSITGNLVISGDLVYAATRDAGIRVIEFGPEFVSAASIVALDIRPGSESNIVNVCSAGRLPVAILGSESIDAESIDGNRLRFGPNGASPIHDLADPVKSPRHLIDVDGDGRLDLVSHYRSNETGIAPENTEACIDGETLDGIAFEGCDAIRTVPTCGRGAKLSMSIIGS